MPHFINLRIFSVLYKYFICKKMVKQMPLFTQFFSCHYSFFVFTLTSFNNFVEKISSCIFTARARLLRLGIESVQLECLPYPPYSGKKIEKIQISTYADPANIRMTESELYKM